LIPGKFIFIVLDGVGIGAAPDAIAYGDDGANTLVGTARAVGGLRLPHLAELGLGNLATIPGVPSVPVARGCFGVMREQSKGKDSTTGHWELAGVVTDREFPLYPRGFPHDVLERFLQKTGCRGYLGNKPASGTEIIAELGDEHLRTGYPIVYTSGDSVFQIAAHDRVIPLERLYEICRMAREEVLVGPHRVGRVIARPFTGASGAYVRTAFRRDFGVSPDKETVLDLLSRQKVPTTGIGKIDDLFSGRGLARTIHTHSNDEGIEALVASSAGTQSGFLMANLVDFDMLYGHRQDAAGLAHALEEFDAALPRVLGTMGLNDVVLLTADHGNDPTDRSNDHTREQVPLLCFSRGSGGNRNLGARSSFADAGKTVADYFQTPGRESLAGISFLKEVLS